MRSVLYHPMYSSIAWLNSATVSKTSPWYISVFASEEVLHDRVVVTVGFTRHRLHTTVVTDQVAPGRVLVLEALVSVHHPPRFRHTNRDRLGQESALNAVDGDGATVWATIERSNIPITGDR